MDKPAAHQLPPKPEENLTPRTVSDQNYLNAWLEDLGLPSDIDFSSPVLEDFRSGVMFIAIIEKLEGVELKGIHRAPKSNAAAIHNCRKIIEFLRQRKKLPSRLFFAEDAILAGESAVIREILDVIYKAYRTRSKTFSRYKRRANFNKTGSEKSLLSAAK